MVIAQYSPLNNGELWMFYQNMRWWFLQVIEASRGGNEEEKLKFYITSCSFCLCNPACSLQSLDHASLRKWGLTILGTGAYLTHPYPALCNHLAPGNPQTCLIMQCPAGSHHRRSHPWQRSCGEDLTGKGSSGLERFPRPAWTSTPKAVQDSRDSLDLLEHLPQNQNLFVYCLLYYAFHQLFWH